MYDNRCGIKTNYLQYKSNYYVDCFAHNGLHQ